MSVPRTSTDRAAAKKAAKSIFTTYCATCHGKTGQGDGPGAAALNPKPRSLSDPLWQKSVSDDHIKKVILEGGVAVKLSPLMAPAKAMIDPKPDGTIDEIVTLVRRLSKRKALPVPARKSAKRIFTTYCATCHGKTGQGDGPGAAAINPKPRSLADPLWQKTVSDDHIKKVILEGGVAVKLSPLMAPAKAMIDPEPEGTIDAMVKLVRGLRAKAAPAKGAGKKKELPAKKQP